VSVSASASMTADRMRGRSRRKAVVLRACCENLLPRTSQSWMAVTDETDAQEDVVVRKVVVPCERMEARSWAVVAVDWTDMRAEGGREQGGGCGAASGWDGWWRSGAARACEGGAARGGHARGLGSLMRSKSPARQNCSWSFGHGGVGRSGNMGGCRCERGPEGGAAGRSNWIDERKEGTETFSKDSSRLSLSSIPVPAHSCSTGNDVEHRRRLVLWSRRRRRRRGRRCRRRRRGWACVLGQVVCGVSESV
jgi:hypothetical protein